MSGIESKVVEAKDFPINKPWGHNIDPNLWYVMIINNGGIGLMVGRTKDADNRMYDFPICFGNVESLSACVCDMPNVDLSTLRPAKGSQVLEAFITIHLSECSLTPQ